MFQFRIQNVGQHVGEPCQTVPASKNDENVGEGSQHFLTCSIMLA